MSSPAASHPARLRFAGWALAILVLAGLAVPSTAAEAPGRLADVRSRIQSTLAELDDVAARSQDSEEAVAAAEDTVARLESELNEVLAAVTSQEEQVAAARAEAEAAAAERDRVEALATGRARRMFMGGVPSDLVLLTEVGSTDLEGALDRLAFLDAIAARDSAAIESLDAVRTRADGAADRYAAALAELQEARAVQEGLLADAEQVFEQRAGALADLRGQQERLLAQQERLEQEERAVQALVRQQEQAARQAAAAAAAGSSGAGSSGAGSSGAGSSGAGSAGDGSAGDGEPAPEPAPPAPPPSSGCYAWPAAGPVTSEYGPRWGRMHAGLDIDGNTGDGVYAAQDGVVTFAGWQGGYGQMTLVQHSDGVTTAYAHQSSIGVSVGETVSRGQYIGAIGTTGAVTGSHLHFETRTSSGASNPRNYLC